MRDYYDTIYISPHLDDAILSCGGQIVQQTSASKRVLIVTVMAGDPPATDLSPFAQSLHERWRLDTNIVALRRAEDITACATVSADYLHLNVADCIYRHHPMTGEFLYASEEALFGRVHPAESGLVTSLAQQFSTFPPSKRIIFPLTAGHHVDHVLTHLAASEWIGSKAMICFEDYPYSRDRTLLNTILGSDDNWAPEVISLSKAAIDTKIEAIKCYRSQISTFFNNLDDMADQVREHCQKVGGERLWYAMIS